MKPTSTNDKFNLLTGRENNELVAFNQFKLHKDVLKPFQKLQELAKKEIDADLQIISSFRDYDRQEKIWNDKVTGIRKVTDDLGNIVQKETLCLDDFLKCIMRFSAIPGASRHHWGTDLDIFDANKISKEDVQLIAAECEAGGACEKLHEWLDEKIDSNNSFGFFRPYNHDLGGVAIEKWHLSFAPISTAFFESYTIAVFKRNIEEGDISEKEYILEHLEAYFQTFVTNITLP